MLVFFLFFFFKLYSAVKETDSIAALFKQIIFMLYMTHTLFLFCISYSLDCIIIELGSLSTDSTLIVT
jgi:hypothetical protein